jgi:hypothetical protein
MSDDSIPPRHVEIQRVTVDIAGSVVTIMPRRAPVGESGPIRGRTLAVFPNPPASNTTPASKLSESVDGRGRPIYAGTIEPGGTPATTVLDLDQPEAVAIGRAAGLTEVLFWDGRRAQLLACHP